MASRGALIRELSIVRHRRLYEYALTALVLEASSSVTTIEALKRSGFWTANTSVSSPGSRYYAVVFDKEGIEVGVVKDLGIRPSHVDSPAELVELVG
jgi:hypothetical protein